MTVFRVTISSMILLPCLMTSVSAQTNQIKWYRATEGLPANHVNTIVQDSSGFIWVGTNLGVCRFDGYSFSRFESPNKKFTNSVVLSMCLDSTNRGLWIAEDEGVFHVAQDGKVTELLQLSDGKLRSLLGTSSILLDAQKRLWIGTSEGCYSIHPSEGWRCVTGRTGYPVINARCMSYYRTRGEIWTCVNRRIILCYNIQTNSSFTLDPFEYIPESSMQDYILTMISNPVTGGVWISTTTGLISIADDSMRTTVIPTRDIEGHLYFKPTVDRQGNLWHVLRTNDSLAYYYRKISHRNGRTLERIFHPDFRKLLPFGTLVEDKDGSVWIGCDGLGLVRNRHILEYDLSYNGPNIPRNAMIADAQTMLVSTWGGVFRLSSDPYQIPDFLTKRVGIVKKACTQLMSGGGKTICWTQSGFGQIQYRNGTIRHLKQPWDYHSSLLPTSEHTLTLNDGSLLFIVPWISDTVYSMNGRRVSKYSLHIPRDQQLDEIAYHAGRRYLGRADDLFFISERRLFRVRNGAVERTFDEHDGFQCYPSHSSICEDSSGTIWIANSRRSDNIAMYRLRNDSLTAFTSEEIGLPFSSIHSLTVDPTGRTILLSTFNGIYFFDLATRHVTRSLTATSGFPITSSNGALFWPDNVLWLLTGYGLLRIPIEYQQSTSQPLRTVLTSMLVDDEKSHTIMTSSTYNFLERPSRVKFIFSTLSYRSPVRFTSMLEGYDEGWSSPHVENTRQYTNLDPGTYIFRVKAIDDLGERPSSETVYSITIPPPFYRTWWFLLGAVSLLAGIIYAGLWYRMRNVVRMENMRRKIAIDLHDEIGSTLTSVSILSAMTVKQLEPQQEDVAKKLSRIGATTRSVIGMMGDTIWSLHPEYDSMSDLHQRLSEMMEEQSEIHGIEMSLVFPDQLRDKALQQDLRRNLYLIAREAIHNAVKYSRCSQISVEFASEQRHILMVIQDNGIGFDLMQHGTGTGMKSMHQRAKEIRASFSIDTKLGQGTTIRVSFVPRKRA